MAELGETPDPKELVPGEPGVLRTTAASLGRFGDVLIRAGGGLRGIDDGGWTGPAADEFHRFFDGEPARWTTCGDCFHTAKDAVTGYVDTLEWAQGQAGYAIDLWAQGEQATRDAEARYEQEQRQAAQAAASAGVSPSAPAPFNNAGDALRSEARAVLDIARGQLGSAGDEAAVAVDRAQQPAPEEPSLLEQAVDGVRDTIGDAIRGAGEAIGDGVRWVGEGVDTVLDWAGDTVDTAVSGAGDLVGTGLEGLGELTGSGGISDAGGKVREFTERAGDRVDSFTDAAGDAVRYGADEAGEAIEDTADDAGDTVEGDDDGAGDDSGGGDDGGDSDDDADGTGDDGDGDGDGDGDEGGDEEGDGSDDVDRNGHWEAANGDTPDPGEVSAQEARAHILYGDADGRGGGHRHDSGVPDKTTFPPDWDDDKIIDEVEDVARNPDSPPVYNEDRETWTVRGTRDEVDIEVIVKPDGEVMTGYPTGGEGVHRNDENGNPQPLE